MGFVGFLKFSLKCTSIVAWPIFGLGYPLWASIRAIETNSNLETQKVNTYWISFSFILLMEYALKDVLEWVSIWPYIKLVIVCCLVIPHFDGSLYFYKHFVHPCLSIDPRVVVDRFNKLRELHLNKENLLIEVERCFRENEPETLENFVELKPNFEEPKVSSKDSNNVEVTEKREVAAIKPFGVIQLNLSQVENRTSSSLEIKEVANIRTPSGDIPDIPPPNNKEVQNEWTCAICQVTAKSKSVLNSHLRGLRHKAAIEKLKIKNQPSKRKDCPVSVQNKSTMPILAAPSGELQHVTISNWTCDKCQVKATCHSDLISHLQGRQHKNTCQKLKREKKSKKGTEKCVLGNEASVEKKVGQKKIKSKYVEIRNLKWWCTICNIFCSCEGNMNSHLNGNKHLQRIQELNCPKGSGSCA